MKILLALHQFYPDFTGGTEAVTLHLANMLQIAGHKVCVVAYSPIHHCADEIFDGVEYDQYIYKKIPVMRFSFVNEPFDLHFGLKQENAQAFAQMWLEKQKPDIVHIMHPMRMCAFTAAAQQMGIPTVITATDLMYVCPKIVMRTMEGQLCADAKSGEQCNKICGDTGHSNHTRMKLASQYLRTAKAVTAPSQFLSDMIRAQISDIDIRVIRHGMSFSGIDTSSLVSLPHEKLVVGYIGTIEQHKGLHFLLEAFNEADAPALLLKIYGNYDTEYGEKFRRRFKKNTAIEFCGAFEQERKNEVYAGLDLVVIPSLCYESYSLVKYEAIARNIPVAVADIGALPEQLEKGKKSFIFSIFEIKQLVDILTSLSEHPDQLLKMKTELASVIVPTIEQESFSYLTLYRQMQRKK